MHTCSAQTIAVFKRAAFKEVRLFGRNHWEAVFIISLQTAIISGDEQTLHLYCTTELVLSLDVQSLQEAVTQCLLTVRLAQFRALCAEHCTVPV